MLGFLRFIGIVNAAAWFGAAIFLMFGVWPGFSSSAMVHWLGAPRAGVAAQLMLERFFTLEIICGCIALAQLLAEWLYTSKPLDRITVAVAAGAFCLTLVAGFGMQPKMERLHFVRYSQSATAGQQERAIRTFRAWEGLTEVVNLVSTAAVLVLLWRTANRAGKPHFASANQFSNKFRG